MLAPHALMIGSGAVVLLLVFERVIYAVIFTQKLQTRKIHVTGSQFIEPATQEKDRLGTRRPGITGLSEHGTARGPVHRCLSQHGLPTLCAVARSLSSRSHPIQAFEIRLVAHPAIPVARAARRPKDRPETPIIRRGEEPRCIPPAAPANNPTPGALGSCNNAWKHPRILQ